MHQYDKDVHAMWEHHFQKAGELKYQVIAAPGMENMAHNLVKHHPHRFLYHSTQWNKFPDGTDRIEIGGFQPTNRIARQHVLMLASFHNNDVTFSQFSVMITLLQSFIKSLTVVLPYYPVGTMERVIQEGQVATANTYAQMFSNLPSCGKPTRLIIYDLHTLQNRFYLHNNAVASLQTSIPLLLKTLTTQTDSNSPHTINCIAFPDDGANKRFAAIFQHLGYDIVTCGKTRKNDDERSITIQDGQPQGKHLLIVDDLVQSGGTLHECGVALRRAGAATVSAYVTHPVFPKDSWKRFLSTGDRNCFKKFYVTNSIPTVAEELPQNDVFEVLDLTEKIVEDLDRYSS
jgi:ribose-phosphate pyrophosphokinase